MRRLLLTLCMIGAMVLSAQAAVLTVGAEGTYSTITLAIAAVGDDDIIELQADTVGGTKTYTESITLGTEDRVEFRARAGDTITWVSSSGPLITASNSGIDVVKFTGLNMQGDQGTTNDHVLLQTGADAVEFEDCTFTYFSYLAIKNGGTGRGLTVDGGTWNVWSGGDYHTQLLDVRSINAADIELDGLVVLGTGLSQTRLLNFQDSDGLTIRGCTIDTDSGDLTHLIQFNGSTDDVLIEYSTFAGGTSYQILQLSAALGEVHDNHTYRFNNHIDFPAAARAIYVQAAEGNEPHNFNEGTIIWGNKVYASTGSTSAIFVARTLGAQVMFNDVYDASATNGSGIQTLDMRHGAVHFNELWDCDNGIIIAGNNSGSYRQFSSSFTFNYFNGDGDDGAFKIDNHDGTNPAPQDSMATIDHNVYVNVANVGSWVDTSNSQDDFPTIAGWAGEIATHSNLVLGKAANSGTELTRIMRMHGMGKYPTIVDGGY